MTGAEDTVQEVPEVNPSNLLERCLVGDIDTRWAMETHVITDNGEEIALAIWRGKAIAMADGSYKNGHGTATYIIEGRPSRGRITSVNISPGYRSNHSSLQCKVTGCFGLVKWSWIYVQNTAS